MNQIYASGGKIQEGFWDNVQMPDSVRAAYGSNLKKLTKDITLMFLTLTENMHIEYRDVSML